MVILNGLSKVPKFRAEHVFFCDNPKSPPEAIKIVTYEEFNIDSFVIPLFHLIFHGQLVSGLLFKF